MKIFLISSLFLLGCSITPKGNYPKSKIDRPYALPDDVAVSSIGYLYDRKQLKDATDSKTGKRESNTIKTLTLPYFEQGIGKNIN